LPPALFLDQPSLMPSKPIIHACVFHLLLLNGRLQLNYDMPKKLHFCLYLSINTYLLHKHDS
jgi:hypothetical protein